MARLAGKISPQSELFLRVCQGVCIMVCPCSRRIFKVRRRRAWKSPLESKHSSCPSSALYSAFQLIFVPVLFLLTVAAWRQILKMEDGSTRLGLEGRTKGDSAVHFLITTPVLRIKRVDGWNKTAHNVRFYCIFYRNVYAWRLGRILPFSVFELTTGDPAFSSRPAAANANTQVAASLCVSRRYSGPLCSRRQSPSPCITLLLSVQSDLTAISSYQLPSFWHEQFWMGITALDWLFVTNLLGKSFSLPRNIPMAKRSQSERRRLPLNARSGTWQEQPWI